MFFDSARDDISGIVHDDIDVSVDRNSLCCDRMKVTEWCSDVELENRRALLLKLGELWEGPSTGGRDDFISAFQQGDR